MDVSNWPVEEEREAGPGGMFFLYKCIFKKIDVLNFGDGDLLNIYMYICIL